MIVAADYLGISQCPSAIGSSCRYIIIMITDRLFPTVIGTPQGIVFCIITAVTSLFRGGFFICPACPPILLYAKQRVCFPGQLRSSPRGLLDRLRHYYRRKNDPSFFPIFFRYFPYKLLKRFLGHSLCCLSAYSLTDRFRRGFCSGSDIKIHIVPVIAKTDFYLRKRLRNLISWHTF